MKISFSHIVSILVAMALVTGLTGAAEAKLAEMTFGGDSPWTIVAASITMEQEEDVYMAVGSVRMIRGQDVIEANKVRLHGEEKTAEATGNVIFTSSDVMITCQRLVYDLDKEIGKFYNATFYFPENHYYLSGDEIEKTGPETFFVLRARATSCDGPTPAWMLTGRSMTVEREGYATLTHATLSTRFLPILYTPWIKVPVKAKRQSGLLMPNIQDSERDGLTFTQPYFWALSDSKDVTVYLTHMAYRGLETCLEFRYKDWGGKGTYRLTYLKDLDPPTIDLPAPYGSRVQDERYWVRGLSDMQTDSGFDVKLDIDYVSDPDYLYEFENSYTGYLSTKEQFLEEFGREPAEALDPLRKNTLLISKAIDRQRLAVTFQYTDDLEDPDNLDTIQRLPKIDLDFPRTLISNTPLFFSNNSEYTYFARKTGVAGHRLDINPMLYLPLSASRYLDVEPSVGFRETTYLPHGLDDTERNDEFNSRELFLANLALSTEVFRIFNVDQLGVEKIKHSINPQVTFSFISERYQGDLPKFDSVDRIAETRKIKYGLVNYLTAKMKKAAPTPASTYREAPDGDEGGAEGDTPSSPIDAEPPTEPQYEYREFLRLGIFRTYDYVEEERDLAYRSPGLPQDFNHPNGPWEIELELNFRPYLYAKANSQYDTYEEQFTYHSVDIRTSDTRGDYFGIEYDLNLEPYRIKNRDKYEYEEIRYLLNLVVTEDLAFQYENRYSLKDEADIATYYSLNYRQQCWGMRLEFMDKPNDKSIALIFSLLGIGEIGSFNYSPPSSDTMQSTEN